MIFALVAIIFLHILVIIDKRENRMSKPFFTLNDGSRIPFLAYGVGTALYDKNVTEEVGLAIRKGLVHFDGAQVICYPQFFSAWVTPAWR